LIDTELALKTQLPSERELASSSASSHHRTPDLHRSCPKAGCSAHGRGTFVAHAPPKVAVTSSASLRTLLRAKPGAHVAEAILPAGGGRASKRERRPSSWRLCSRTGCRCCGNRPCPPRGSFPASCGEPETTVLRARCGGATIEPARAAQSWWRPAPAGREVAGIRPAVRSPDRAHDLRAGASVRALVSFFRETATLRPS
jgi:hypothetical protein